jgi:hypothetical protein
LMPGPRAAKRMAEVTTDTAEGNRESAPPSVSGSRKKTRSPRRGPVLLGKPKRERLAAFRRRFPGFRRKKSLWTRPWTGRRALSSPCWG